MTPAAPVMAVALIASLAGCVDTGNGPAEADLYVQGVSARTFAVRDGWEVDLEQAKLAFGPLTLCPGVSAGELCQTARAEWLDSAVVDALSSRATRAGEIIGSRGAVHSWMYDLGYVSLLSKAEPFETEAARELGERSVVVEGCAHKEQRQLCFEIGLAVMQSGETEQGVPLVRVSGEQRVVAEFGDVSRLTLRFDPQRWLETIDFEQLAEDAGCTASCEDVIVVESNTQAARALRSALENTARPELDWTRDN